MLIRFLLVSGFAAALSACGTHAYIPLEGQLHGSVAPPVELKAVSGTVSTASFSRPTQLAGLNAGGQAAGVAGAEAASWFAGPGTDYTVEVANQAVGKETGWWSMILYFGSLGALPVMIEQEYESTVVLKDRGGSEIFRNSERYRMRGSMAILPTAMVVGTPGNSTSTRATLDQMNRHKLALGQHIAASRGEYEKAVAADTVQAHRDYLEQNPGSFFRSASLTRLAALAPTRNALRFHIDNLKLAPDYLAYIPEDQALWFVGPEGLRVHDVLTQSRSQAESILAARIRTGGSAYKVFNADEIARLQQSGVKPNLVAAMMEVSAQTVAAPVAQAVSSAPVVTPAAMTATPAAAPENPNAGDVAEQCAKRLAAMQLCNQVPSLGRNICKAQVNRTYDHIACALIQ